jgi:hypothetical protein
VFLEVRYKCTNIMHPGYILYNLVVIINEPVGYSYKSSYVSLSMHLGYMWGGVYILSLWECTPVWGLTYTVFMGVYMCGSVYVYIYVYMESLWGCFRHLSVGRL